MGGRGQGEGVDKHKSQEWNNKSQALIVCFHEKKNLLIQLECTILSNENICSMFFKVPPGHSKFSVNHY